MGDRTDLPGLEKNPRQNAVKKAWKGIKLLQEVSLGGRPNNAKAVPEELFRSKYAEIYKQLWKKTGDRPTQDQIAYKFGIGERTLRDYLDDYELSWPPA
jgi:hypothetical protein